MQPQPRRLPQAISRCLRIAAFLGGAAHLAFSAPALAQAQSSKTPDASASPTAEVVKLIPDHDVSITPQADNDVVRFEADKVDYDSDGDTVTASGNVILRRDDQSVRATTVTWNRKTGQIVASGNIRLVDADGNILYTDRVELTDKLKTGAIEDLLLVLREGGRLAAKSGVRDEKGGIVLYRAAYSPCSVEDGNGCPKRPSWRITAARVVYDPVKRRVSYKGAMFHLFGVPVLPLPGLGHTSDFRAESGLLIPDFRLSASNGMEFSDSYYWRLGNNRDLTLTGYVYTEALPMLSAKYRQLTGSGAYQVTGYATRSGRIPLSDGGAKTDDLRGYLEANGRFQLGKNWSVTGSGRIASDRTFLRRYDISREDRMRSTINVERITTDSYFSFAGWAVQTLRSGEQQGLLPVALPVIDYRHRRNLLDGKLELQANSLAISRTSGQDTQRAFGSARWDMRRITEWGQEVSFTGLVRGDAYHTSQNQLSAELYRGQAGWQFRSIAVGAVDVKWPLAGPLFGGSQVLTPRVQIVATPSVRNMIIPNEDARAIDLEDSNLFALNRFPGYDRIEDGVRFTYGFDWRFNGPNWRVSTTVGQSYRLTSEPTLLPDGTGLTSRTSDIVGRTELRFSDIVKFTHRFRLDKDNFTVRRNEIDATLGNHRTYVEAGYLRLNRDISGLEDLRDREELRLAGRIAFAKYWSVFGSTVVNLTDKAEDPQFIESDGYQLLRHRLGFAYTDDCLDLSFTWRRDYLATGDARSGNTFQISFGLRNLGFR